MILHNNRFLKRSNMLWYWWLSVILFTRKVSTLYLLLFRCALFVIILGLWLINFIFLLIILKFAWLLPIIIFFLFLIRIRGLLIVHWDRSFDFYPFTIYFMYILELDDFVYTLNMLISDKSESSWLMSTFILKYNSLINWSKSLKIAFECLQIQIVRQTTYEYLSALVGVIWWFKLFRSSLLRWLFVMILLRLVKFFLNLLSLLILWWMSNWWPSILLLLLLYRHHFLFFVWLLIICHLDDTLIARISNMLLLLFAFNNTIMDGWLWLKSIFFRKCRFTLYFFATNKMCLFAEHRSDWELIHESDESETSRFLKLV